MDRRKHYTQMSDAEINLLKSKIQWKTFKFSEHLVERMREKNVGIADLQSLLSEFSVVECHNNIPKEIRVLIRNSAGCCAVLSITKYVIVTTYWNSTSDHHATLDKSLYKWNVNLEQILRD